MKNLTLGVVITTMNDGIHKVYSELLPQVKNVDYIVISHQLTEEDTFLNVVTKIQDEYKNVTYSKLLWKWLSKNRNNGIKLCKADIIHICDDDLVYIYWFEKIIRNWYNNSNKKAIVFQAVNDKWVFHFPKKEKHNIFSIAKISSWGITFHRDVFFKYNVHFDERFWLGTKIKTWEENIFLRDIQRKWIILSQINTAIVHHPDESSWLNYDEYLVISRIMVYKRMYNIFYAFLIWHMIMITHYKLYKSNFWMRTFYRNFRRWMVNKK